MIMNLPRPLLLATTSLVLLVTACSQPEDAARLLTPQFGAPGNDRAEAVAATLAHPHVFVASIYTRADRTSGRAVLRRYNRDGTLAWDRRSPLLNDNNTQVGGLGTDAAGNAYLAYNSAGDRPSDADTPVVHALAKYGPGGVLLWLIDLRDSAPMPGVISYTQALATTGGGATYVGINFYNLADTPRGALPGVLRKYDSRGKLLWGRTLPAGVEAADTVLDLAVGGDGSLYALESPDFPDSGTSDTTQVLSKYTPAGVEAWKVGVSGGNYRYTRLAAGGGSVYLGGDWTDPAEAELYPAVARYDPSGALYWETVFERRPGYYGNLTDVAADASGNVYVAASVADDGFNPDPLLRKLSPTAGTRWTYRAGRPDDFVVSGPTGLVARSDRELYVGGLTSGNVNGENQGGFDAFLLRFDGQGARVWVR